MNGKLMELVRAIVRPVITLGFSGILVYKVLVGVAVPEWFQTTTIGLITWWFAMRGAEEKPKP